MCGDCNMYAQEIIRTHPHAQGNTNDVLIRCVEECYACAQACTACADACLGEQMVRQPTQCIRLNLDCTDVCAATGAVATRRTGANDQVIRRLLAHCGPACRTRGPEVKHHGGQPEHCRPGTAAGPR